MATRVSNLAKLRPHSTRFVLRLRVDKIRTRDGEQGKTYEVAAVDAAGRRTQLTFYGESASLVGSTLTAGQTYVFRGGMARMPAGVWSVTDVDLDVAFQSHSSADLDMENHISVHVPERTIASVISDGGGIAVDVAFLLVVP